MADHTAIYSVGETLAKLLRDNMRELTSPDSLTLLALEEIEIDDAAKLNLYLYEVKEEKHLKNQELEEVNSNELRYPPLSLNLLYLVTPYAKDKRDEHRILGEAMRIFHDNPILKGEVLQGSLAGGDEELHLILAPTSLEDLSKIFPHAKPYRLSVCYEVRSVKIESRRKEKIVRVEERKIEYYQMKMRGREIG